jgi:hypothetical protein
MMGMMRGDSGDVPDPPTVAPTTVQPPPNTPAPTMDLLQTCVDDTITLYENSLELRIAMQAFGGSINCSGKQTACDLDLDSADVELFKTICEAEGGQPQQFSDGFPDETYEIQCAGSTESTHYPIALQFDDVVECAAPSCNTAMEGFWDAIIYVNYIGQLEEKVGLICTSDSIPEPIELINACQEMYAPNRPICEVHENWCVFNLGKVDDMNFSCQDYCVERGGTCLGSSGTYGNGNPYCEVDIPPEESDPSGCFDYQGTGTCVCSL